MVPTFILDEMRNYKTYIVPQVNLKKEFELQKFKIYQPFIKDNQITLMFRNGEYVFLGVRISKIIADISSGELQQHVF